MLIAQISDLHIKTDGALAYGRVDTRTMFARCVAHVARLKPAPDAVLITGDLVDFGRLAEYTLLHDLLAPLTMPIHLAVGNHDERQALRQVFDARHWPLLHAHPEFVQYAVTIGEIRVVVLDTVVTGQGAGMLCPARLDWLAQTLAQHHGPTAIAMHHPPFETGLQAMDAQGLLSGGPELETLLMRHPQVRAVWCGHLHRAIHTRFAHATVSCAPSPAHQVALQLFSDAPDQFVMEPPGYALHAWIGGRIVSHHVAIGDFDGPFDFRHDGALID
jgi:3',5'-cyclic-AMP phosphodiesterase